MRDTALLLALPVTSSEAERLRRGHDEVAYALVTQCVRTLYDSAQRDYLVNAFALDDAEASDLTERRKRYNLDRSTVCDHENNALAAVAQQLLDMQPGDPEKLFGDYITPDVDLTEPERRATLQAVGPDEIHPLGELAYDYCEHEVGLTASGFAHYTEIDCHARALIDGVTGHTVFYNHDSNMRDVLPRIVVMQGGKRGREDIDVLGGRSFNINFPAPLAKKGDRIRLRWTLLLGSPLPDAAPETGFGHVADVPTRNLTLKAYFHDASLPVRPHCYTARPRFLMRPLEPVRPVNIRPGNLIAHRWASTEEGTAYVLRWGWQE
jgi:hypothetical protein